MKQPRLSITVAAALLALAACGSTPGTPASQDLAGTSSGASSGGGQQSGATGGDASDQHSAADGEMPTGSSGANPTTDTTSPTGTSATGLTDVPGSTPVEGPTSDVTKPETTITISGDLDAQTAAWFSEMCTGITKPFFDGTNALLGAGVSGAMGDAGSSGTSATALRQQVVDALGAASNKIEDGLGKLRSLPPPTIDHGADIAQAAMTSMQSVIPVFRSAADELASAPVTDMESLGKAITELAALDALDDSATEGLDLDADLQADVLKLPACQDVFGPMAGLATAQVPPTG